MVYLHYMKKNGYMYVGMMVLRLALPLGIRFVDSMDVLELSMSNTKDICDPIILLYTIIWNILFIVLLTELPIYKYMYNLKVSHIIVRPALVNLRPASIHSSIYTSIHHSSMHPSIHLSIHPSLHPFVQSLYINFSRMSIAGQLLLIRNRGYIFYWFNIFCVLSVYCLVKSVRIELEIEEMLTKLLAKVIMIENHNIECIHNLHQIIYVENITILYNMLF